MVNCAVVGCSNRSDVTGRKKRPTSARFFSLPKVIENQCERTKTLSAKRRSLWLARIKRANFNHVSPNVRVCGVHFIKGEPSNLFDETNPDWAPSLSLGHGTRHADSARHDRRAKRLAHKRRADVEAIAVASEASPRACPDSPQPPQAEEVSADENETGIAVQTDMTTQDIQALEQHSVVLNEHLYTLQKEKEQLENARIQHHLVRTACELSCFHIWTSENYRQQSREPSPNGVPGASSKPAYQHNSAPEPSETIIELEEWGLNCASQASLVHEVLTHEPLPSRHESLPSRHESHASSQSVRSLQAPVGLLEQEASVLHSSARTQSKRKRRRECADDALAEHVGKLRCTADL
ncbi:uncharacterized protein LOC144114524 [Amblyomma americanum]